MKARETLLNAEEGEDISETHMHRMTGFRHVDDDAQFSSEFDRSHGISRHRETAGRRKLYGSKQWESEIDDAIAKHNRIYGR